MEFKEFLKLINGGQVKHWVEIAKAIKVDPDTITKWKSLPEAQEAIAKGISESLDKMEQSGKNDWRMWQAKLKMLGVENKVEIENKTEDVRIQILKRFGLLDDEGDKIPFD